MSDTYWVLGSGTYRLQKETDDGYSVITMGGTLEMSIPQHFTMLLLRILALPAIRKKRIDSGELEVTDGIGIENRVNGWTVAYHPPLAESKGYYLVEGMEESVEIGESELVVVPVYDSRLLARLREFSVQNPNL